jgi:hypothetical protein
LSPISHSKEIIFAMWPKYAWKQLNKLCKSHFFIAEHLLFVAEQDE